MYDPEADAYFERASEQTNDVSVDLWLEGWTLFGVRLDRTGRTRIVQTESYLTPVEDITTLRGGPTTAQRAAELHETWDREDTMQPKTEPIDEGYVEENVYELGQYSSSGEPSGGPEVNAVGPTATDGAQIGGTHTSGGQLANLIDPTEDQLANLIDPTEDQLANLIDPTEDQLANLIDPTEDQLANLIDPTEDQLANLIDPTEDQLANLIDPTEDQLANLIDAIGDELANLISPTRDQLANLIDPTEDQLANLIGAIGDELANLISPTRDQLANLIHVHPTEGQPVIPLDAYGGNRNRRRLISGSTGGMCLRSMSKDLCKSRLRSGCKESCGCYPKKPVHPQTNRAYANKTKKPRVCGKSKRPGRSPSRAPNKRKNGKKADGT